MKLTNMFYPELNKHTHNKLLEGEEWRDVATHVGHYQISSYGRVKRIAQFVPRMTHGTPQLIWFPELILKANNDSRGYPQVTLNCGWQRVARVHRLVAESFLAAPHEDILIENKKAGIDKALVNHKDENPLNAHADNLEWCTVCYNNRYSSKFENYEKIRGGQNYNALLSEEDVTKIIGLLDEGNVSQENIAKMFNTKQITISNIHTGRSWAWFTGRQWTPRSCRKKSNSAPISSDTRNVH